MAKFKAPVKYVTSVRAKDMTFFLKILFRWTGSVWQTLYIDAFIFISLWVAINVTYAVYLQQNDKGDTLKKFNSFVLHIKKIGDGVELTMVLGFFVSTVFRRWWQVAMTIPRTTAAAFALQSATYFTEDKIVAKNIRVEVLRYLNLSWILAMRNMCPQICKRFHITRNIRKETCCQRIKKMCCSNDEERFPIEKINEDSEVRRYSPGGLIKKDEAKVLHKYQFKKRNSTTEFLIPMQWASRLVTKASAAKLFRSDGDLKDLLKVLDEFRKSLENLMTHNEIHIPLVYTQIVVIAVYSYCLAELFTTHQTTIGNDVAPMVISNMTAGEVARSYIRQYTQNDGRDLPIYSIFKFIFFMGWFKTAVALLNPLGSDREALPTSMMLSQNLEMSYDIANDTDFFPSWLTCDADSMKHLQRKDLNFDADAAKQKEVTEEEISRDDTNGEMPTDDKDIELKLIA